MCSSVWPVCAVLCVALQSSELTQTNAAAVDCECRRCGAPMCRQVCRLDCLRCCKCCVYFGLRVGRRSATNRNAAAAAAASHSSQVHPPGTAAGRSARCKRSGRYTGPTTLSLLLVSVTRDGPPRLISCSNVVHDLRISPPDVFIK